MHLPYSSTRQIKTPLNPGRRFRFPLCSVIAKSASDFLDRASNPTIDESFNRAALRRRVQTLLD